MDDVAIRYRSNEMSVGCTMHALSTLVAVSLVTESSPQPAAMPEFDHYIFKKRREGFLVHHGFRSVSRGRSPARSAESAILPTVQVGSRQRVAVDAVRFCRVDGGRAGPDQDVFAERHEHQVIGIDAAWIVAGVMYGQRFGDFAPEMLVGYPCCTDLTLETEVGVALLVLGAGPFPASGFGFANLSHEPVERFLWHLHCRSIRQKLSWSNDA
jgi:hypothetical protein